ncbi:MAG: hypothetical protein AAB415_00265 [Patescibacteria group bacterium]
MNKLYAILAIVGLVFGVVADSAFAAPILAPTAPLLSFSQTKKELAGLSKKQTAITITGLLEVFHTDDFVNQNSSYRYFLNLGDRRVEFQPTEQIDSPSGTQIKLDKAYEVGDKIIAEATVDNLHFLNQPRRLSTGNQTLAVLLIDFADSPDRPFTADEATNLIFNDQVQNFYHEQSDNQVNLVGRVFDWHRLPRNGVDEQGVCRWPAFGKGNELNQVLLNQVSNIGSYQRVIVMAHHPCMLGARGTVGQVSMLIGDKTYRLSQASIGSLAGFNDDFNMPFKWRRIDYYLSHELGHNLGLMHANGWDCGEVVLGEKCYNLESSNPFDVMGMGRGGLHFNAYFKEFLGWLKSDSILTINRTGAYLLAPLEVTDTTLPRGAKIVLPNSRHSFYIEYRRGRGFDAKLSEESYAPNQEGLMINLAMQPIWGDPYPYTRLLDISPSKTPWYEDAIEAVLFADHKTIFTDPASGLTIGPIVSASDDNISFKVSFETP